MTNDTSTSCVTTELFNSWRGGGDITAKTLKVWLIVDCCRGAGGDSGDNGGGDCDGGGGG